jgi:hypothetical protein
MKINIEVELCEGTDMKSVESAVNRFCIENFQNKAEVTIND